MWHLVYSFYAEDYNTKMTVIFGLFAWLGVFLASVGLVMFYRCSRYTSYYDIYKEQKEKNEKSHSSSASFTRMPC
jgi:palmitoyltransferase ZDHHC13/17